MGPWVAFVRDGTTNGTYLANVPYRTFLVFVPPDRYAVPMPSSPTREQLAAPPSFRRPTRADAVAVARRQFLAGERVEMQRVAEELHVGRTTLYRWVGEREQLLGEIVVGLLGDWVAQVAPQARGRGADRWLDTLRRFLELAATSAPLTRFTREEPALALRILADRRGAVFAASRDALRAQLDAAAPGVPASDTALEIVQLTCVSLVWAPLATGQEPDVDGAVAVAKALLTAGL